MTNENENETNEKNTGKTRVRRTRLQIKADLEAKLAKLQAKIDGNYDETGDDSYMVKRLKRAIRRRETAMGTAETLLRGKRGTDKSPAVPDIYTKIRNAQDRLESLNASKDRALVMEARVPFDIEKLRELLTEVNNGGTVEFPTDLFRLEGEPSESEIEAGSVSNQESD